MLKAMKTKCGVVAFLILAAPAAALAQTTGASFLEISNSPRAYALGMSDAVTALGASAVDANPANMGFMPQKFEVSTSYATLLAGTNLEYLAAAFSPSSLGPLDALGLSVTRLQTPTIPGADASGNPTGSSFTSGDLAVTLGASMHVTSDLRLGLAAKVLQETIAGYHSNDAIAGNFGATWVVTPYHHPLTLAAGVTNFGEGTRFISQTDPLPTSLNAGVALPLGSFLVVVEVNHTLYDNMTQFGTGLEYTIGPVALRVGYLEQAQGATNVAYNDQTSGGQFLDGLEAGVGIKYGVVRVDYAFSEQAVDFGPTQRIALTIQWGDKGHREHRRSVELQENHENPADQERPDWLLRTIGNY